MGWHTYTMMRALKTQPALSQSFVIAGAPSKMVLVPRIKLLTWVTNYLTSKSDDSLILLFHFTMTVFTIDSNKGPDELHHD